MEKQQDAFLGGAALLYKIWSLKYDKVHIILKRTNS